MKFCLFNIAYDKSFHGFQIQPSARTVQGEIKKMLSPLGIDRIYVASRTDADVRASSNIIEIEYADCKKVAKIVDSIEGITVRGYLESDFFIRLRGHFTKEYLYIDRVSEIRSNVDDVLSEFKNGRQVSYVRDDPKRLNLLDLQYSLTGRIILLRFIGKSFSWNYVRIASQCIIDRITGKLNDEEWNMLLEGEKKCSRKGKGENLILTSIKSDLPFIPYKSQKMKKISLSILRSFVWASQIEPEALSELIASISFISRDSDSKTE